MRKSERRNNKTGRPRLDPDGVLDDVVAYLAGGRAVGERQHRALVHAAVGLVLLEDLDERYDHAYAWLLEEPLHIRLLAALGQLGGEAAVSFAVRELTANAPRGLSPYSRTVAAERVAEMRAARGNGTRRSLGEQLGPALECWRARHPGPVPTEREVFVGTVRILYDAVYDCYAHYPRLRQATLHRAFLTVLALFDQDAQREARAAGQSAQE